MSDDPYLIMLVKINAIACGHSTVMHLWIVKSDFLMQMILLSEKRLKDDQKDYKRHCRNQLTLTVTVKVTPPINSTYM